jgi:MFS family permease
MRTHRPNQARAEGDGHERRPHRSPVTTDDLLSQLLWPRLLKSYRLAAAPGRLVMCLGFVVVIALLDRVYAGIAKETLGQGPLALPDATGQALAARALYDLFLGVPLEFLREHWPVMVLFLPVLACGLAITGGAVSRSVAYEVSLGATLPWRRAHRFAWSRALGLIGVVVVPVAGLWLVAALTALVGRLLFDWRITAALGAVIFFVFVAIALLLVVVMLLYVLAGPMLVPALAVEGSDSFDAVNRSFAYVLARPGRYAAYVIVLTIVAALALGVAASVVVATNDLALSLTGVPAPGSDAWSASQWGERVPAHFRVTGFFLSLWTVVPLLLLASYAVSLLFTSGTLLFLLMRRVVDGQDIAELWVPDEPGPGAGPAGASSGGPPSDPSSGTPVGPAGGPLSGAAGAPAPEKTPGLVEVSAQAQPPGAPPSGTVA